MDFQFTQRLAFIGEWFQEEASMARQFYIYFYPNDSAVEIFDQKTRKIFLRRTKIESLSEAEFFVGAKLNILGRQIDILDFGDGTTRKKLANVRKKTLAIIKPEAIAIMGDILDFFINNKFSINNGRMVQLSPNDVKRFFASNKNGDVELPTLLNQFATAPIVGFELISDDAIEKLKSLTNTPNLSTERYQNENQHFFNPDKIKNSIYFSQNEEETLKELQMFFETKNEFKTTVALDRSTTLAIIKPHAIKEGKTGRIISDINRSGFKITALKMVTLPRTNCEEFYEVYRGVLPEYVQIVAQLCSGVCMAMEIVAEDVNKDCQAEFRKLCGPMDPEVAVQLRPHTLRAKYGKNKVLNAIHCTDLPEDTLLEIEYFFKILD